MDIQLSDEQLILKFRFQNVINELCGIAPAAKTGSHFENLSSHLIFVRLPGLTHLDNFTVTLSFVRLAGL